MAVELGKLGRDLNHEIQMFDPNEHIKIDMFKDLADELFIRLKCSDELTKKFIEVMLINMKVFDHKQRRYGSGNISEFGETGVMIRVNDKINSVV